MSISGIYKIRNKRNGHLYVGSTVDFATRKREHLHKLRHGKHHSAYLQRAFDKYGEQAFVFTLIEEVPRDRDLLYVREVYWVETLKPRYNVCQVNGSKLGYTPTEATKQKLREYNLRPEVVAKKKAELTGHEVRPETLEKIKEARAKQPVTEKMRQGLEIGRALPFEQRKGMTGKQHSEATKQKQREAALAQKEQRSETMKAVWQQQREQRSEAQKRAWQKRRLSPPQ